MTALDIRTLGPLEVLLDQRRLQVGTRKQRALLALLLIHRGRAVSVDRIVMALWGPDAPAARRRDVWVYVSRLRKALGDAGPALARINGGYLLDVADDAVDAGRFEALVEEGRRLLYPDPRAASLVLAEGLAMWSGAAYAEFATEEFAVAEAVRLEEARLAAIELRLEADLAWKDADALIPEIESMVRLHPLRASLTASLMVALYRRGRQAEALRTYRAFADLLGEESGLAPPQELRDLEESILMDDPALHPSRSRLPVRIPERIASFVGREAELVEVATQLREHRLVVITGPGGVGKTALATEVGRRLALQFDDVVFVDLTKAEDSQDAAAVAADALRVQVGSSGALEAITDRVGARRVLALFDNCEVAAADAAATVMALLQQAPGLRVLATSRIVLGIPGELVRRVAPLGTEPGGDAQRLLSDRVESLPDRVTEPIADPDLHAIVNRTEGLPLAIELAAAQLSTWSAAEIIAALDDPLATLVAPERAGPERHRELRANVAWSERLLPPVAAELLRRLSVFRSGFGFDAVGPVAGFGSLEDLEARHQLRRLVDASLVLVESGERARYRLLEPVRDYARLRLADAGETDLVAERHARYYLSRLEQLAPILEHGPGDTLRQTLADGGNILAALRWAVLATDAEAAQRGTAYAVPLLRMSTSADEALAAVEDALAMSEAQTRSRAELLFVAAPLWWLGRGVDAWRAPIGELQTLAEALEDPEVTGWAALRRADAAMSEDADPDLVVARYRQAVEALREARSPHITKAFHQLAWYLYWQWDRMAEAEAIASEWLATAHAHGWPHEAVIARAFGSWLALAGGDTAKAETDGAAVASAYRRHGDHRSAALQMEMLAIASLQRGDASEALRRNKVAQLAAEEAGAKPWLWSMTLTASCIKAALHDLPGASEDLLDIVSAGRAEPRLSANIAHVACRVTALAEPQTAAVILGACERVLAPSGFLGTPRLVVPALDALIGEPEARLRAALGDEAFEAAWARGASLDTAEAELLVREELERIVARE